MVDANTLISMDCLTFVWLISPKRIFSPRYDVWSESIYKKVKDQWYPTNSIGGICSILLICINENDT